MAWRFVLGAAAALLLAGCASNSDVIESAVAQARQACEAKGGHFVLKHPPRMETGELLDHDVSVDADCIAPGDEAK